MSCVLCGRTLPLLRTAGWKRVVFGNEIVSACPGCVNRRRGEAERLQRFVNNMEA